MIKELQIRPFARPLLVWIAGIMLQTVFSCCTYFWVLLLLPVIILTTAGLVLRGQEHFCYETRWLWGVVFLSLLLFLSIQKTAYSQFEALSEHPASLLSRWAREEQQRLLEPIAKLNLTDEEKSVLATITVGYRQAMSREVRNRFSATGVAHILAVSGFHVAIVCGFLSFLFSPQEWMLPVDSLHLAACAIVGICCDNGLGGLFCEGSVDAYNVSDGQNVG